MRLTLHIAIRFLLAKKRAMFMSLAGIVFGVAFFIVTQAQTSGFEKFFIQSIWATNGAIRVQDAYQPGIRSLIAFGESGGAGFEVPLREGRTYIAGVQNPRRIMEAVWEWSEVAGVSEVLRGKVKAASGFREEETEVWGIRLKDHLSVSALGSQIRYGALQNFHEDPQAILIGTLLAERLSTDIGQTILLSHIGESRRYRVAAIFESGVEEFDKRRVFVHLPEARRLLDEPSVASFLQVTLYDNDKADTVAPHMEEALRHDVDAWQDREKTWLEVFRVLRISSGITMSVIILIAGLGMFNTLAIIVMERRREIAILRSMGYSRKDIIRVFVNQGIVVLAIGTALGWLLAFLMTWGIASLPIRIRGIFSTDHFIVNWSLSHYIAATVVATIVVLIAAYIPARRAARIEPGQIIRGTGG